MSGRSVFRGLFWGFVALVVVAHVAGGWHYSNRIIDDAFTPNPEPIVVPEGDFALSDVTISSELGDMDAWYLPAPGPTWVVHIHSLNATPAEPQVLFQALQEAGNPQLSIAYRNDEDQPTDPSGLHQYGATEWQEVQGAVDFARDNGAQEVVFAGYGAGGSHALSYVYRHNFDYIAGVILDSPNIDLGWTIDYRKSQEDLPVLPMSVPPTMAWVAKFFTSLRIDVNWKTLDYIERSERSLRVPVLVFHGTDDLSTPIEESIALQETQPELVHLIQMDGAGHVGSFDTDFDRYLSEVLAFLQDVS